MHYLMPDHKVLSPAETEAVLSAYSITIEEIPPLIYEDAALAHLRMKGEDTPVGSVVEIMVVRTKFNDTDSDDPEDRSKVKYRVIKRV